MFTLDCYSWKIEDRPQRFFILQLTSLITLDLSGNQITGVPNEIKNLKDLQILNLSGNPLSETEKANIKKLLPLATITF